MIYCESFLDCIPTLFVIAILIWCYYMYVFVLCINIVQHENMAKFICYIIIFNILFIMVIVTYFKVMCADIAVVPNEFKLPDNTFREIQDAASDEVKNNLLKQFCQSRGLTILTRSTEGYIRFCNICKVVKPDRAHHCSVCGTCVLKMDHHCPWVKNCVCFSNYKFFLLFLFYITIFCIFVTSTTMEYYIRIISGSLQNIIYKIEMHLLVGFVTACAFGLLLLIFLGDHIKMVFTNETTLESSREPVFVEEAEEELTFNIGKCDNFFEVFGYNCLLWFIPVFTSLGDGVEFPIRDVS